MSLVLSSDLDNCHITTTVADFFYTYYIFLHCKKIFLKIKKKKSQNFTKQLFFYEPN